MDQSLSPDYQPQQKDNAYQSPRPPQAVDEHALATLLVQGYQWIDECAPQGRLWLACSGGRDSLSMAHIAHRLARLGKLPQTPTLLHVNHRMQADSDAWAMQVKNWAEQQSMSCEVLCVNTALADEQDARQARYAAMFAVMQAGDVLMLAHHQDDQAETVLMRLFQGAGVTGLAGMSEWQAQRWVDLEHGTKTLYLWRPWLSMRRETLTQYAVHHQLDYIDDPTNEAGDNLRSWMRRQLLPLLEGRFPQVVSGIARSASLCADADAITTEQVQRDMQVVVENDSVSMPWQQWLSVGRLLTLSQPRRRLVIRKWLQADAPLPPSKALVDAVLALAVRQDANHQTQLEWRYKSYRFIDNPNDNPAERPLSITPAHVPQGMTKPLAQGKADPATSANAIDSSAKLVQSQLNQYQHQHQHQHQHTGRGSNVEQAWIIRRHQDRVYRLDAAWLTWLQLPLIKHQGSVGAVQPALAWLVLRGHKDGQDNLSSAKHLQLHPCRQWRWLFDGAAWQQWLADQLASKAAAKTAMPSALLNDQAGSTSPISMSADPISWDIRPYQRREPMRLQGRTISHSGKKLCQTLAIPMWMRDSLMVLRIEGVPVLLATSEREWILASDWAGMLAILLQRQSLFRIEQD